MVNEKTEPKVAPRIVGQGDWIIFPLEQTNSTQLEWFQKRRSQRATYYIDKCWYGKPKSAAEPYKDGINVTEGGEKQSPADPVSCY